MMHSFIEKIRSWVPLFVLSAISLFVELAVIRWLSAEVRLMAYYKNLILLAAFLGLSIGFAIVGKGKEHRFQFHWMWAMFVAVTILIGFVSRDRLLVYPGGADEYFWDSTQISFWLALASFLGSVLLFFLLTVFIFIPLGQMVGEEMAKYVPVRAYIVNILASLIGVWIFSLLSWVQSPPWIWFGIALIGIGWFYYRQNKLKWPVVAVFIVTLVGIGVFGIGTKWSPYNRLNLAPITYERKSDGEKVLFGYVLDVQHSFYQSAVNLKPESIDELRQEASEATVEEAVETAFAYEVPYLLVPDNSRVLVVGSGMGNDVSAALRSNMEDITAVDIDPLIIELGRQFHPEQPYSDPRVVPYVGDAREFFSSTSEKYDLVVFGLLDSHTLLSGMSSVRLDSYVYTLDSFRQVQRLLNGDGYVSLSFATNEWMEERLGRMLAVVFVDSTVYFRKSLIGTTFVVGPVTPEQQAATRLAVWTPNPDYDYLPLATDDWPYLYLRDRVIPNGYWQALLLIGLVCLAIMSRSFPESLRPDWHFWLLGAAFLLIEFKSITELALLFGTTWFVNSLAISGVLSMALMANLFVLSRPRVDLRWMYALLFASIGLGYLIPLDIFAGLPGLLRAVSSTLLLTLPLLFAGVIFSESLRRMDETSRPLASNFGGSAVGGILEYGSSLWGIKSMYLLAAALYIGACIAAFRPGKKNE